MDENSHLKASWSPIVRYTIASAINLAILTLGVVVGVFIAPHFTKTASANPISETQAASVQNQAPSPIPTPASSGPKITTVQPGMTTGTVGIYLILAHHVQSDELVVNGYDLLKLQNA